jgi:hypothetical protein
MVHMDHIIFLRKMLIECMTDQAVYAILQVRALKTGVKLFSPHDLRRTFVSDLFDTGADIMTVAKMVGHDQVQTTICYDRQGEEVKKNSFKFLYVPYCGKRLKIEIYYENRTWPHAKFYHLEMEHVFSHNYCELN